MNTKSKDEKRTLLWRSAIIGSSLLIVIIVGFFIYKFFTDNPLEGRWDSQDGDLTMTIEEKTVLFTWPNETDKEESFLKVKYTMDMGTKTFRLYLDEASLDAVRESADEGLSAELKALSAGALEASYDYNVENNRLTLTEREYGEQMVFHKE